METPENAEAACANAPKRKAGTSHIDSIAMVRFLSRLLFESFDPFMVDFNDRQERQVRCFGPCSILQDSAL